MKALHELFAGPILINDSEQHTLAMIMADVLAGKMPQYFLESKLQATSTHDVIGATKGKKLIIPMVGMIMASDFTYEGVTYQYGTQTLATWLRQAYANNSITEIEIQANSPGGSTDAVDVLLEALSERNKPVKTVVTGVLGSAAYWIAAKTDRITLTNRFNRVGSIGVMATLVDSSKRLESYGITIHTIYASQSSEKNRDSEEAKKGNYEAFQKSTLDPVAQAFIDDVKESRSTIKAESLKGGVYYAKEAIERGLADELIEAASGSDTTTTQSQITTTSMSKFKLFAMLLKRKPEATVNNPDGTEKTETDLVAELTATMADHDNVVEGLEAQITTLKAFETQATQLTTDLDNEKKAHDGTKATLQEKENEITQLNAKLAQSPAQPPITPTNPGKAQPTAIAVSDDEEKILAAMPHNQVADTL